MVSIHELCSKALSRSLDDLLADLLASQATVIALMALTLLAACRVLFTWFLLPEEDKGKEWRRLMPFCVISVIACALSLRLLFSEYSGVGNLILEGSEGSAPSYYILYLRAHAVCRFYIVDRLFRFTWFYSAAQHLSAVQSSYTNFAAH